MAAIVAETRAETSRENIPVSGDARGVTAAADFAAPPGRAVGGASSGVKDRLAAASGPAVALAATWLLRLGALAIGVVIWHYAVATKLNFYINFQNVPAPETASAI
jgi:hypothetical protein